MKRQKQETKVMFWIALAYCITFIISVVYTVKHLNLCSTSSVRKWIGSSYIIFYFFLTNKYLFFCLMWKIYDNIYTTFQKFGVIKIFNVLKEVFFTQGLHLFDQK